MTVTRKVHGRKLGDFHNGQLFRHPWEVTLDEGVLARFMSSFPETSPIYRSNHFARSLGFNGRVVHPLALFNFGMSFSAQDISEQAVANLAWLDLRFPNPAYVGDSISAYSRILSATPSKRKNRGTVHVQTTVVDQENSPVCVFERIILVPKGRILEKGESWTGKIPWTMTPYPVLIDNLDFGPGAPISSFEGFLEDFRVGDILIHDTGRTVGFSENYELSTLFCNPHPLHTDALYCETRSISRRPIIDSGVIFAFVHAMAARDTGGQVIWTMGFDNGMTPYPAMPGDTIYAAQKVLAKELISRFAGKITFRLAGIKNEHPSSLIEAGIDIFKPAKGRGSKPVPSKILEIDRTVLLRRKS